MTRKRRILMLVHPGRIFVEAMRNYLTGLETYSNNEVLFETAVDRGVRYGYDVERDVDLSAFDVVVIHYSLRVALDRVAPNFKDALARFEGLKVLIIQDEYQNTNQAREWIANSGTHVVLTVVPEQHIAAVYPAELCGDAEFINVLTGYVPLVFESGFQPIPHAIREYDIVHRGRDLPMWLGDLAREKLVIAERMAEAADAHGLQHDIKWKTEDRIHGSDWYRFVQSGRVTLGSESGANVFDLTGELSAAVNSFQAEHPEVPYDIVAERFVEEENIGVRMNQISPRIFEAIGLRTGLALFEGDYSGVVQPDEHFIPIKKDFSNLDKVIESIRDVAAVEAMTARAHRDVIASGQYSFRRLAELLDEVVERKFRELDHIVPSPTDGLPRSRSAVLGTSAGGLMAQELSTTAEVLQFHAKRSTEFATKLREQADDPAIDRVRAKLAGAKQEISRLESELHTASTDHGTLTTAIADLESEAKPDLKTSARRTAMLAKHHALRSLKETRARLKGDR